MPLESLLHYKRYATLSAYEYVINVFPLFIQYLEKLIAPLNLNAFYVFHPIHSLFELKGVLSLIATLVFAVSLSVALRKNRVAFLGLMFLQCRSCRSFTSLHWVKILSQRDTFTCPLSVM